MKKQALKFIAALSLFVVVGVHAQQQQQIDEDAIPNISNGKLVDMTANTIKMRNNAIDGDPLDTKISELTNEPVLGSGVLLLCQSGENLRSCDVGDLPASTGGGASSHDDLTGVTPHQHHVKTEDTNTQLSESEVDGFVSNNGYLTSEIDGSLVNELQDITLIGDTLSATQSSINIDLSKYLDDTDTFVTNKDSHDHNGGDGAQINYITLSNLPSIPSLTSDLTNDSGYLTTEVDGSIGNELQTISISGSELTLSDGGGTLTLPSGGGSDGDGIYDGSGALQSGTTTIDLPAASSFNIDGSDGSTVFSAGSAQTTITDGTGNSSVSVKASGIHLNGVIRIDDLAGSTGNVLFSSGGGSNAWRDIVEADIADLVHATDTNTSVLTECSGSQLLEADGDCIITSTLGSGSEGTTVSDTSEIALTLTNVDITADLVSGSIDESKLDASVNASLDLADTASQGSHTIDTNTQLSNSQVATAAASEGFVSGPHTIDTQLTQEQVEDLVDGVLVGGSGITSTYNDANGTLTIDYTGSGGGAGDGNGIYDADGTINSTTTVDLNNNAVRFRDDGVNKLSVFDTTVYMNAEAGDRVEVNTSEIRLSHSSGAVEFNGDSGSSGQFLKSNGSSMQSFANLSESDISDLAHTTDTRSTTVNYLSSSSTIIATLSGAPIIYPSTFFPIATTSAAGAITSADKTKLDNTVTGPHTTNTNSSTECATGETLGGASDGCVSLSSGGSSKYTYRYAINAEEANSFLTANNYQWAYGNGQNTQSNMGISIYVPSTETCAVTAMSFRGNVESTLSVELVHNGTPKGALANVSTVSERGAVNSSFTPISLSNGDYVNFRTQLVTTASNQSLVTAWVSCTEI